MGEVLIDTDVLIWLIEEAHEDVLQAVALEFDLCVSAVTVFEFLTGVFRCQKKQLVELLERHFKTIPVTHEIAKKAAEIEADLMRRGETMAPRDVIIGATAITMKIPLWTRNVSHFERLIRYGLMLFDETKVTELIMRARI